MVQITPDTEFIIGIDFGHGETSASFYGIEKQNKMDLDILPGLKVIKSAVAILEQEGRESICVGESAIQNAPFARKFKISFKNRPSGMSADERECMVKFMKGVYSGILDRHPDYKSRKHVVCIARPSQDEKWKSEESAYIQIAEDAGLPVAGIQKESRAAYFRARTQPDSKIDTQVKEGVLIVDYGSSAIDFTYLNNKLQKPIDHGCDLGASEVERLLLNYAMEHPCDPYMSEFSKTYGKDKDSNPYNQMLYSFRKAKEDFYRNKLPKFSLPIYYDDLTSSEKSPIDGLGRFVVSREDVNKILGMDTPEGYIEKVRSEVKRFKEEKLKNNKVACVYLTGGASRMDFVRQIFMDVFNLNDNQCPADDNPSLIVSQGVAHLSYADYRTQGKESQLRSKAKNVIDSFDWTGKLKETIVVSVKKSIIDKAYSIMVDYKNGNIYDYHTLTNGHVGDIYYGPMEGNHDNGFQKVRNIEALISKFESTFNGYVHYDFIPQCKSLIQDNVIAAINKELIMTFSDFKFEKDSSSDIPLSGLSASMSQDGANILKWRFTSEGDGHVLYDAVSYCYPIRIMVRWNKKKDRWDSDRQQHFEYYTQHYKSIYPSASDWNNFITTYISIGGVSGAKDQIRKYVDEMIKEYVSYAKLAIFFK